MDDAIAPNTPVRLTREQVRRVDRLAVERLGLPSAVLMENAAINAASFVVDLLQAHEDELGGDPRAVVLCGGGNNGGDGYALARHLHNFGLGVDVFTGVDPGKLTGDARGNHDALAALGVPVTPLLDTDAIAAAAPAWHTAGVIVDALLGTGFRGAAVREPMAMLIRSVNALRHPRVVSLDLPSGLDCDTGDAADPTVRASATVTFVAEKVGFASPAAQERLGRVVAADIGVPLAWALDVASGRENDAGHRR